MTARRAYPLPTNMPPITKPHEGKRHDPFVMICVGLSTPTGILVASAATLTPMSHFMLGSIGIVASDIMTLMAIVLMLCIYKMGEFLECALDPSVFAARSNFATAQTNQRPPSPQNFVFRRKSVHP